MISKHRTNDQILYADSDIIKCGKYTYVKKWFGITVFRSVHIEKNKFSDDAYKGSDKEKGIGFKKK